MGAQTGRSLQVLLPLMFTEHLHVPGPVGALAESRDVRGSTGVCVEDTTMNRRGGP